jgi:hypothetical protein
MVTAALRVSKKQRKPRLIRQKSLINELRTLQSMDRKLIRPGRMYAIQTGMLLDKGRAGRGMYFLHNNIKPSQCVCYAKIQISCWPSPPRRRLLQTQMVSKLHVHLCLQDVKSNACTAPHLSVLRSLGPVGRMPAGAAHDSGSSSSAAQHPNGKCI